MDYEALDPAIVAALPPGSDVLSVVLHGKTRWSVGLRVDIQVGGEEEEYFLKIVERAEWVDMARAEFESQQALAAVIPDNVIAPTAWGLFRDNPAKAFYLCRFRSLRPQVPPLSDFLDIVKRLHRNSVSPTGKFGFHCTTYCGPPPIRTEWTDSWEEFWGRQFLNDVAYAQGVYGENKALAELSEEFVKRVVARLLRPLQTGGRSIKPSLCHGDLWDGNIQIDRETRKAVLFDSCCFYGHAEMDLQSVGDPRYALNMEAIRAYKAEVGASDPEEDFYDRHQLYMLRNDIVLAAIAPEWKSLLETVQGKMQKMLQRFPNGYDDFVERSVQREAI